MIKKLKLGLLIAGLSLVVGVGSADAINLTFDANTNATLGSYTYIIKSASVATSLVNDGTSLAVEVPTGSTFTLISADRHTLTTTGGTVTCTNVSSTLVITGLTSTTRTITPSTTPCGAITSGGGGGGGGGSYVAPVVTPATPATPATPGNVIAGCGNSTTGFSTSSGVSCAGNTSTIPATPATPASPSTTTGSYNLGTTTLKNGSRGEAVRELQRFLNDKLNLGLVLDGALGPKTIAVIKQWQAENGLVADGLIGAKTKAMMNAQ